MAEHEPGFVRSGRIVYTYAPEGSSLGVLTGYEVDGAFVLEHVITFPGASADTLVAMLRAGLEAAWARGYERIIFCLPHAERPFPALGVIGRRMGFKPYQDDGEVTWWVRWK